MMSASRGAPFAPVPRLLAELGARLALAVGSAVGGGVAAAGDGAGSRAGNETRGVDVTAGCAGAGACVVCAVRVHANPITVSDPARTSHGAIAGRPPARRFFLLRGTPAMFAPAPALHCGAAQVNGTLTPAMLSLAVL
jgi:hypothetical protein